MDKRSVNWRGYMPAMTTPFDRAGQLDKPGLGRLVEWLVGEGMHGLVLAGTSGEWFSLSPAERAELCATARSHASGALPIIAGCSAYTDRKSVV